MPSIEDSQVRSQTRFSNLGLTQNGSRTMNVKLIREIESADKEHKITEVFQPTDNGDDLVESFLISEDNS
jgi:hypothetical protein